MQSPARYQQFLLVAVVAATWTSFDFVLPFLPLFITELGVTDLAEAALWSGLIVGVGPLLAAVASPMWGAIGDRFGLKSSVLRVIVSFVFLLFVTGLITTPLELLGLRVLMGLASGFSAVVLALASADVPQDQVGRVIGRIQMAQSLPLVVAPVVGGWIADQVGVRANFFLASAILLVAAVVFHLGYRDSERAVPKPRRDGSRPSLSLRQLVSQPWMLAVFSVLFAVNFVDNGLVPMLPLLVLSLHGQSGQIATLIGIIVASGPLATAVASLAVGRLLAGRLGPRRLLIAALPGAALACLGLVAAGQVFHLMGLRALIGLFCGGLVTTAFTAGTLAGTHERSATAFGAMTAAGLLGRAAGPLIAGVAATIDFRLVFLLDAAMFAAALLAVVLWLRPAEKPHDTGIPLPAH